jgi:hypothetical protein
LAFHSNYQQPNDSLADIWTIHIETKVLQRLTFRGDCLNPAWSRPGAQATPGSTDSTANVAIGSDTTSWPISETGVEACHLAANMTVTAGDNARLWNNPDVTAGLASADLTSGAMLKVVGGPLWGRVLRESDVSGWWWQVETESGAASGWIWQSRLLECE